MGTTDPRISGRTRRWHARRRDFEVCFPGGASTDFLTEQHLDVRMDFSEVQKAGSRMGTGTMIVLDDQTCPVGMVSNLDISSRRNPAAGARPAGADSIGRSASWRNGRRTRGSPETSRSWRFRPNSSAPGNTFCALAPGAMEPLQSALKYFRDDFERHIREHRCPWR